MTLILPSRHELAGDAASLEMQAWSEQHDFCMACWVQARWVWMGCQTHHLVKRSRRVCHLAWNLLRLCERCHRLAEGERVRQGSEILPTLSFGVCLGLKQENDMENWQPELLELLFGRRLPAQEKLPHALVELRHRNRPFIDWRELRRA